MNLDFIPTHCIFCYKRLCPVSGIVSSVFCPWCKTTEGKIDFPAYQFWCVKGLMTRLTIRLKSFEVNFESNQTTIKELGNGKLIFHTDHYLEFEFNPELLVQHILTYMVFS